MAKNGIYLWLCTKCTNVPQIPRFMLTFQMLFVLIHTERFFEVLRVRGFLALLSYQVLSFKGDTE